MSEIPTYPNECKHGEPPSQCWRCLSAENQRATAHAAEWMARDEAHIYEARMLRGVIRMMLAAAVPHPVEHPTMWKAWRSAAALMGLPPTKSGVIATADERLESRLLGNGCAACSVETALIRVVDPLTESSSIHPRFHTCRTGMREALPRKGK